jgi:hypothetical protein
MKEVDLKKLYQDAVFLRLIRQGYSKFEAEMEVKKWIIMKKTN